MSVGTVDYIEIIRDFLGGEEGKLFAQRARQYGMAEDGPELLPLMVLARAAERCEAAVTATTEGLAAFRRDIEGFGEVIRKLKESLVGAVGGEIEDRLVQTLDDLQRETASMARALAHAEFTAASTVRSRAIGEEVGDLRRAAQEFVRVGGAGPTSGGAGATDAPEEGGFAFTALELAYFGGGAAAIGAIACIVLLMVAHALHIVV